MKELKDSKNLYDYIIHLSTYDINRMIEEAETETVQAVKDTKIDEAETEEEKIFYLKLEELKTQLLQKKLIAKGVY